MVLNRRGGLGKERDSEEKVRPIQAEGYRKGSLPKPQLGRDAEEELSGSPAVSIKDFYRPRVRSFPAQGEKVTPYVLPGPLSTDSVQVVPMPKPGMGALKAV